MTTTDTHFKNALVKLLGEVLQGPGEPAFILNPHDPGLLPRLESVSATEASARPTRGTTSIAAHADHVHFGLTILNRWVNGEKEPWMGADWEASWKRGTVNEAQWRALRDKLRQEAEAWQKGVERHTQWDEMAAAGALGSLAHTAYHLGAIRQLMVAVGK